MPLITRRFLFGAGVAATYVVPAWLATGHAAPTQRGGRRPERAPRAAALPVVVLDPGHGGRDPGAIGISGTYEKNVVFAAAQELRRQLLATRRYRVEMTRTRDVFVPLEARVAFAQRKGASLFISMHADAVEDGPRVRGASVYRLSERASDAQSAALAMRENRANRFGGQGFTDYPPEVARILASLVRRETVTGSASVQRHMVAALDRDLPMLPNPGRHAAFAVLKAPDIPSILVEMGFMSNRQDEAALRRPDHRRRVAGAMTRAVNAWFSARNRMADADVAMLEPEE